MSPLLAPRVVLERRKLLDPLAQAQKEPPSKAEESLRRKNLRLSLPKRERVMVSKMKLFKLVTVNLIATTQLP